MYKAEALRMLGGTAATAEAVRITTAAVSQWPDELPDRIADRVIAAWARRTYPVELEAAMHAVVEEGAHA